MLVAFLLCCHKIIDDLAISESVAHSIDWGMTRANVWEIAGRPNNIDTDGTWTYRIWEGWDSTRQILVVGFDDNGLSEVPFTVGEL